MNALEVRAGFQLFDKNGDKKISRDELTTVLRSLGNNPSESEISDLMRVRNTSVSVSVLYLLIYKNYY